MDDATAALVALGGRHRRQPCGARGPTGHGTTALSAPTCSPRGAQPRARAIPMAPIPRGPAAAAIRAAPHLCVCIS